MSRYIKLPNGVVIDTQNIRVIVRQEINEYVVLIEGSPASPKINGEELELLEKYLGVVVLEVPPKIETSKVIH